MKGLSISYFVSDCAAWYSGADGKAVTAPETTVSRNAFIEVTPPAGRKVKWISEDDFILVKGDRAVTRTEKVTIRARPGWKLTKPSPQDGVIEFSPGVMMAYAVAGDLGEDGGDGNGHICSYETTVVTNHVTVPIISVTNATSEANAILVPQMEVSSVTVGFSAEVLVVSNGIHEVITTDMPCFVCSGGHPEAIVTTNQLEITPYTFLWEWKIPGTTWTGVGDSTLSDSVEVETYGKHAVSITASATDLPDYCVECCACSDTANTNALVMKLESETVSKALDCSRTTIGVCEMVTLNVLPPYEAPLPFWRIDNGGGTIRVPFGYSTTYEAPDSEDAVTITATIGEMEGSIDFTVIEPTGIRLENNSIGYGAPSVAPTWMSIPYFANIYLQPDNVSFYRLQIREGGSPIVGTGAFAPPYKHPSMEYHAPNGPHSMLDQVVDGKGTLCEYRDNINGWIDILTDPDEGDIYWEMEWTWENLKGEARNSLGKIRQNYHMGTVNGQPRLTVTKDRSGYWLSPDPGVAQPTP